MLTADTITDEQIRELLEGLRAVPLANRNYHDIRACGVALGWLRSPRVGGKNAARARCAELLNARAKETTP